jgi:diguanylate cyclase
MNRTDRRIEAPMFRASQDDLRAILSGIPGMIGYWDRDLRNRLANGAYVEFFGVGPDEMQGIAYQ